MIKNPSAKAGDVGSVPGLGDPPEKQTATHSSILVWEITCTEKPGTVHRVAKLDMTEHAQKKVQIEQWNSHLHGHIRSTT